MGRYRVQITGADRVARRMQIAAATIDDDVLEAQKALGETSELIFAAYALKRTGRLARGIVSRVLGSVVQVEAHAKDPRSGYDYVGVTRFGHRVARIEPRADRAPASVRATGRSRARGAHAALRIPVGGTAIYRRWSRGFHPARDWAEAAIPQVEAAAERQAQKLGEKVAERI